jgi:tetratricopeptide (TPR) repeat protein
MDDTRDPPTVPSDPSPDGSVIAGRYRVRRRLGRGASKEVYLAYDERLDREVAVALVVGASRGSTALARLEREARVTGRLGDHPNVITVYDTCELDGVPCLVMRAMAGGSLAGTLARGRLSAADAVRVGRDIAVALAHAHAHGVIHRDVKPGNVWLDDRGAAALGDFGIAHEDGADRLTAEGVVLGTARYASPEQIRGAEVGPASDLYSLGVTLYELVTGRPPFEASDPRHVLAQHLSEPPTPPSQRAPATPPELERLILELLEKEPLDRPRSAAAVAERLSAVRIGDAPPARRVVAALVARAGRGDPEVLHGVLARATAVIERHGGAVERRLDALVGLFELTEGSRAARAALQIRSELSELRCGIEGGEVFVADGIATGAPIEAAGRLAERARKGEIVLGEVVRGSLPSARVDADSGRLLGFDEEPLLRVPDTPFVDRADDLELLETVFAQAAAERVCQMLTVIGMPGVGKSRLAAEFAARLGPQATVLAGRCTPFGEGAAYQALADMLGHDPRAMVEEVLGDDEPAARALLGALGLSGEPVPIEEIGWGLRRLLERVAREGPLLVVVEDVHWAEPALLEALDHVVALSSGSPILVLCLTRPELLETRPQWATPQRNRAVRVLEPLGNDDARELAQRLGAGTSAERIAHRAEGNPLFLEQLVAVDDGRDTHELPVSLQAVLAARIAQLEPGERALLQRASIEGRAFHAGAAEAGAALVTLVRKGLIEPDRPAYTGEEAFRFTHALIRDTAYAGVPKQRRAELHAVLAEWLSRHDAADAVVGHHLAQACRLRAELGHADPVLVERAVQHLTAAAHAALSSADPAAGMGLLERAIALVDGNARVRLLPALGMALFEAGRMSEAAAVLDEAIERAPEPRVRARAEVEREFVRLETDANAPTRRADRVARAALTALGDDDAGACRAGSLRAQAAWNAGRVEQADTAWMEANHRAGDQRQRFWILGWRATAAVLGPAPVDAAIARCEAFRDELSVSPIAVAWAINPLASLHAMRGDVELAERLLRQANETLAELVGFNTTVNHHEGLVWLFAGRPERVESALRPAVATLEAMGDGALLATTRSMLAQAAYALGRFEEAGHECRAAAGAAAADDILTQVVWRGVLAKVLARAGSHDRAEALAREAVALAEPTDLLAHKADAMLDLGEVLRLCSRPAEAHDAIVAGLALHERKGCIARVRNHVWEV